MELPDEKHRFFTRENINRAIWSFVTAVIVAIFGIIYLKLFGPQKFVIDSEYQSQKPIPVYTVPYMPEQKEESEEEEEQQEPQSSLKIIDKNKYEVTLVGQTEQPSGSWFEIYSDDGQVQIRGRGNHSGFYSVTITDWQCGKVYFYRAVAGFPGHRAEGELEAIYTPPCEK
jgi:hypothetical protein